MKISQILLSAALMTATSVAIAGHGDAAAGETKSKTCAGCHGAAGLSAVPNYPNLAGQKEAYLVKAITDFKSKTRVDATMNAMTAGLSDADIANLAAYYSGL